MSSPAHHKKPRLSFWQIWNMSFGFLGIQFGFALQNANTSRIFETLGAKTEDIPILWIAAPVTGLLVQPIIGHLSDKTWNRFGRRRPFFLVGAILASIALIFMPNSWELWVAAGMLWIMDASINISMEPFRAFVGDMLPAEQRNTGFAMQSFFIGIGAVVASALPWVLTNWFGISNTAPEGVVPDSVKFAFYCGGIIFFLAVLWTVVKTKEYPPEELEAYEAAEAEEQAASGLGNYDPTPVPSSRFFRAAVLWIALGSLGTLLLASLGGEKELYILTVGFVAVGVLQLVAGLMARSGGTSGFTEVMGDLFKMPVTMRQLAVVQFFSWFALFSMWIYTTNSVAGYHYNMQVSATTLDEMKGIVMPMDSTTDGAIGLQKDLAMFTERQDEAGSAKITSGAAKFFLGEIKEQDRPANYDELPETDKFLNKYGISAPSFEELARVNKEFNEGSDWVGILFASYNGFAAFFAFLLPLLARRINRRRTHLVALTAGGLGLISILFIHDPLWLIVSMVGVGLAWASILSMPYAMLTSSLPSKKMGVFMGIFNFFIVIPQITAASILGPLVTVFNGESIYILAIGGIVMIFSGFLTLGVKDNEVQ